MSGLSLQRVRPIHLPSFERCDVSIVIPVHNHWAVTKRCLRSIAASTSGPPFEVILVDDASTDRTATAAPGIRGLRVVRLDTNQGFIAACNAGAAAARGEFVLFLNNDTVTTPGWMQAMIRVFDEEADCGAVGARLLYPNGLLQEAGGIVWREGQAWNFGNRDDPERPEYNYLRRTDYCSGAALLVRRQMFNELGGFDSRYAPAYWEDVDLCFKLAERGLAVWYQPAATVYHYDGVSSRTARSGNVKRHQDSNAQVFRDRWQTRLRTQEPFAEANLFRAADRHRGPTVMVFDHYVPTPDRDAGSVFMDRLLSELVARRYRVIFWPSNLFRWPGYADALQQRGIHVVYGPATIADYAARVGGRIDYAIAYRAPVAAEQLPLVRPFANAVGYVAVDLEPLREERRAQVTGDSSGRADALRAREQAVLSVADCVAAHSRVEVELIRQWAPGAHVVELPLPGPAVRRGDRSFADRSDLLFVGSTHPPNVDALVHFVDTAWPRLRDRLGTARLRVVGEVCSAVPALRRQAGIDLVGHVSDLAPWFDEARVFVAPLRYGAGIKGKILAALRAGLPVVTSPVGAEGLDLEHGCSGLVASTDEEFVEAVIRLYTDSGLWHRVRSGGLRLAEQREGGEQFTSSVTQFMERLESANAVRQAR